MNFQAVQYFIMHDCLIARYEAQCATREANVCLILFILRNAFACLLLAYYYVVRRTARSSCGDRAWILRMNDQDSQLNCIKERIRHQVSGPASTKNRATLQRSKAISFTRALSLFIFKGQKYF